MIERATTRIEGLAHPAAYVMRRDRVDQLVDDLKRAKELSERLGRDVSAGPENDFAAAEVRAHILVRQLTGVRRRLKRLARQLVPRKARIGGIATPPKFPSRDGKREIVREVTATLKMARRIQTGLWVRSAEPAPGVRGKPARMSRRVVATAARLLPHEYRLRYWRKWVGEVRRLDPVPGSRWRRTTLVATIFMAALVSGRRWY